MLSGVTPTSSITQPRAFSNKTFSPITSAKTNIRWPICTPSQPEISRKNTTSSPPFCASTTCRVVKTPSTSWLICFCASWWMKLKTHPTSSFTGRAWPTTPISILWTACSSCTKRVWASFWAKTSPTSTRATSTTHFDLSSRTRMPRSGRCGIYSFSRSFSPTTISR